MLLILALLFLSPALVYGYCDHMYGVSSPNDSCGNPIKVGERYVLLDQNGRYLVTDANGGTRAFMLQFERAAYELYTVDANLDREDYCLATGSTIAGTPSVKVGLWKYGGRFSNKCDIIFQDPTNTGSYGLQTYDNTAYQQIYYKNDDELWTTPQLKCGEAFNLTFKLIKVNADTPALLFLDTAPNFAAPC
ncbi:hypothetical protein F5H01DRAFT_336819 [Linnemannia elongata]|nr:hypothetical protein F5H01DRAFT_336819 [Linnemannia elongata]